MDAVPEAELVSAARRGDQRAFELLVLVSQDGVRAYLGVRLRDRHQVDDLAQEAFVIAYRKLETFRDGESFPAWVRGIAHRLLLAHLRARRRHPQHGGASLDALCDRAASEAAAGDEAGLLARLRACVKLLAAGERALLERRYLDGTGIAELCADGATQHSAMTMSLHRLRQRLRACIERQPLTGPA